jgi:TonB-linked SusC/RagA family outer membrane protein
MRHRLLTAFASGATLVFSPVVAMAAAQGPDADSLATLVAAASWVPTRSTTVAPLRRTISLDLKDVSIKQTLQEIGRRGGIEIAYGDDVLRARARVSLQQELITVQDAVVTALAGTGLEAFVSLRGTTILVRAGSAVAQGDSLMGRVTDTTGASLAGVRISVVGSRFGAVTAPDGRYAIADVPPGTYRLQARLIGYAVAETDVILAAGQTVTADLRLVPQAIELNPIVAVGYGEQRKATLTGSVSAVQGEQIQGVPTVNVSNTLGGQLPGLVTVNQSGEPGYDGATIRIRGNHTLNDNSALIVIDGVADRVGGLERLDPQDIESISILKDASAAIYGARAANGVILVTTKRGRSGVVQAPQLTVNINQGFNHPTRTPQMADAATYMTMLNEINLYRNLPPAYTADQIQKTRAGADPWLYPNTDWFGAVIKPMSLQTRGNVALRGSGERIGYYLSLGGLTEDGYYQNSATRYNQYSFRSNIDGRVTDHLGLRFDVTGRLEDRNFPNRSAGSIFRALMRGKPNLPAYWPNGLPGPDIEFGDNPVVTGTPATGYDKDQRDYVQGTIGLDFKVPGVSGLTVRSNASYDVIFRSERQWRTPWTLYTWDYVTRDSSGQPVLQPAKRGFNAPQLNQTDGRGTSILLNLVAEYRRTVGPHTVGILGGIERQTADSSYVNAFRRDFVSDQIDQIFAGSDLGKTNDGTEYVAARQNYFTRVNYAFEDKYLFEVVARYDGSYIFPANKRFGFFPGISAGWRISEEPFFRNHVSVFDDLKLRASWGKTGNDRINQWQYLATYGFGSGYVFGGTQEVKSIFQTRTPNPNVTWEVAQQLDFGIEGRLLKNRLSFEVDRFTERRNNILSFRNASVPQTAGLSLPRENIGIVDNRGWDGSVTWRQQLAGDVSYEVTLNGGYAQNKILFWDETPGAPPWQRSTGYRMNTGLYYKAIGVFKDWAAVNAYPHWAGARPGDIIFADVDANDTIDARDMIRVNKNGDPTFTGGLTLAAQVKSFDFRVFFHAAFDAVQYFRTESGDIGNFTAEYAANRWTPDNPNAPGPRTFNRTDEYWVANPNTYFLRDASFIRLKSVEIGYHVPGRIAARMGVHDLRLYASGYNLFLWDQFRVLDPETRDSQGQYYPQQRVFNAGASVTF